MPPERFGQYGMIRHILSHITARHLITRSRAGRFQSSTSSSLMKSGTQPSVSRQELLELSQASSKSLPPVLDKKLNLFMTMSRRLTFFACELVCTPTRLARTAPPSICAARARSPELSHDNDCHMFFFYPGTDAAQSRYLKVWQSAKHAAGAV